jgi:methyltransferase
MVSTSLYLAFLAVIGLERLHELRVATRNARTAFARGGVEHGQAHYRVMVVMHALFLPACAAEVVALHRPFPGAVGWIAASLVVAAQLLRASAVRALGDRWNTRIIVVPDLQPITEGPYRYLRHPNYVAVVVEMTCIPAVHGAWVTCLLFTVANAAVLFVRIRGEEAALGQSWEVAFADKSRFLPRGPNAG